MTINEYRKAYPKQWESYDSWFTPELAQILDKPEFLDKVMAKINEEPDNFEFQRTLYDHYMLVKEYEKALKTIFDTMLKFPELEEDLETTLDNELYVDGDVVEERVDFREFFNSREELYEEREKVSRITRSVIYTNEEKLNKIKDLVNGSPYNAVFYEGLWKAYIGRLELDKAKEVALKIIEIAKEKGVKEVISKKYTRKFLGSLDLTKYYEARNIYWEAYYHGEKNLITSEIIEKYDLKK